MISTIEQRARRALAHPDVAWIIPLAPAKYRDNPLVLQQGLAAAASGNPSLGDSSAFREAYGALTSWHEAQTLLDRASRLYHDPAIRARFGDAAVERAWNSPDAAYQLLIQAGADGDIADRGAAHEILEVIAGAREMASEHGVPFGSEPAAAPIPGDAVSQRREYDELIARSIDGPLSHADEARLHQLAGPAADREERAAAAHAASLTAPPTRPGEYERLIERANSGEISEAERGRMMTLAGQRAVAEGRITAEDLPFDNVLDQGGSNAGNSDT